MASTEDNPNPNIIPSPSFAIICASLALDPTTNTILLAHAPADQLAITTTTTHCLPQGPKKLDEGLVHAAVRHTDELTNTAAEPLRTLVPTRAARWHYGDGHSSPREESEVVENLDNSEPFAVCVGEEGGVSRIVFYFLVMAKKKEKEKNEGGEQREGEEGVWVRVEDIEGSVGVSEDERTVIRIGVDIAKKNRIMS